MRSLRKLTIVVVIVALMVMMFPAALVLAEDGTVIIFHTNDIHGRAEGDKATDKDGNPVDKGVIGYARYKQIIDEENLLHPNQVFVFDAGDAVHGTNFATLSNGESIIDLMNMVGVDAMTCGNHEFNYGPDQLKNLEGKAAFPIMGANIVKEDKSTFFNVNSMTFKATESVTLGIVGITTPETKVKADPKYTKGLSFGAGATEEDITALIPVIQKEVDDLKKAGVGFVVVMAHVGVDAESKVRTDLLIPKLKDIDLVIDGHSHTTYENGTVIKDADGIDVLLVQTGSYFNNIGKVTLEFAGGNLHSRKAELISFKDVRDKEGDAAIKAKIDDFNKANEAVLGQVIGKTATDLDGKRENVRAGETNLGNLIADSILKASGADVVLTNGGGIRATIPAGDITMGDAMTVLPFGNLVTVIKVKGQDIIDALAHGSASYPEPAGGFPHVAGMTFTILTDDAGKFSKIGDVMIADKAIDPAAEYTLATNDFMAGGGDGYTMFGGKPQVTLLGLMLDIFVEEIKALSKDGPFTVTTDGRLKVESETAATTTTPTTAPEETTEQTTVLVTATKTAPGGKLPATGESTMYIMIGSLLIVIAVAFVISRRKVSDI